MQAMSDVDKSSSSTSRPTTHWEPWPGADGQARRPDSGGSKVGGTLEAPAHEAPRWGFWELLGPVVVGTLALATLGGVVAIGMLVAAWISVAIFAIGAVAAGVYLLRLRNISDVGIRAWQRVLREEHLPPMDIDAIRKARRMQALTVGGFLVASGATALAFAVSNAWP